MPRKKLVSNKCCNRYDVVPLGVKAVVSAIYEPPQTGTTSSIDIVEDPDAAKVDRVAKLLGLKKVFIFCVCFFFFDCLN